MAVCGPTRHGSLTCRGQKRPLWQLSFRRLEDNWHSRASNLSFSTKQRISGVDSRLPHVVTLQHSGERLCWIRCFVENWHSALHGFYDDFSVPAIRAALTTGMVVTRSAKGSASFGSDMVTWQKKRCICICIFKVFTYRYRYIYIYLYICMSIYLSLHLSI